MAISRNRCYVCEKGVVFGNSVSHANNKTRRTWKPNLQVVRVLNEGKTIKVKLKKPKAKTFTIDGAVFPTEQVRLIIEAAREGKSLLELVVYDGSDDGEKVYNTLTVIGQPIPGTKAPVKPDPTTTTCSGEASSSQPLIASASRTLRKAKTPGRSTPGTGGMMLVAPVASTRLS